MNETTKEEPEAAPGRACSAPSLEVAPLPTSGQPVAPEQIIEFEFEVEDRTGASGSEGEAGITGVEELDIRLPGGVALKIGVALVAVSFIVGYPIAALAAIIFGAKYALYFYGISWGFFLPGVVIGGREAHRRVGSRLTFWKGKRFKVWRVRLATGKRFGWWFRERK